MLAIGGLAAAAAISALPLAIGIGYLSMRRPRFGFPRFAAAVGAGLAAVLPAALVQFGLPPLTPGAPNLLFHAFVVIALTEEGSKWLLLRLFRRRWGAADNAAPAGMAASLAFAFFETIVYASTNPSAALIRAFTAAPLHAACGAWIGRSVFGDSGLRSSALFVFAVLVHGAYDLALLVPGFPAPIPITIALLGLLVALFSIKTDHAGDN